MGKIRHGHGYSFFGNLFVGAVGSLIGWFLMGFLKVQAPTLLAQVAMAVAGAVVFFLIIGLFKGKRRKAASKEDDK